jgi:predicted peroxiredoxin
MNLPDLPDLPDPPGFALLLWAATPEHPELAVTPLVHALAARALDGEVELHFAGPAVRWLVEGVADAVWSTPARDKSIGDWLRELAASGVSLYACSMAYAAWVCEQERLIPECSGQVGATAFIARQCEPRWHILVY